MKDSIHKYFRVGTIQWMSFPLSDPMDSLKAICRDDYFDAIELKGYGAKNEEAKKLLEQSHLKVCYGAQPRLLGPKLNPNALDEAERMKAEATLKEALDEAEYLGARGIAFLAGKMAAGNEGSGLLSAAENHAERVRLRCGKGHERGAGGVRL